MVTYFQYCFLGKIYRLELPWYRFLYGNQDFNNVVNVESWWIHNRIFQDDWPRRRGEDLVKLWNVEGPHFSTKHPHSSTTFHMTSAFFHNVPRNIHKIYTFLHNVPHYIHISPSNLHNVPHNIHFPPLWADAMIDQSLCWAHTHFVGWDLGKHVDPDQTPQNAASDQGLHYLRYTNFYKKIKWKWKNTPDTPKTGNELVQLIRMDKSIMQIWVKLIPPTFCCPG